MTNAVLFAFFLIFLVVRIVVRVARKALGRAQELQQAAHQKGREVQRRWEESEERKELERLRDDVLQRTSAQVREEPPSAPIARPVDADFPVPPPPPPPVVDLTLPPVPPVPPLARPPARLTRPQRPPAPAPATAPATAPTPASVPDVDPDLTLARLERRLFSDSAPGYEVIERFKGEYRGRRVRWTGELDRADRLLGTPGVEVVLEAARRPEDPSARPLRYAFRLELAEGEDLLGAPARSVTVEGTLDECDPYLRQLALSDARRAEG